MAVFSSYRTSYYRCPKTSGLPTDTDHQDCVYFVRRNNQLQDVPRIRLQDADCGTRYESCIVLRGENKQTHTKKSSDSKVSFLNVGILDSQSQKQRKVQTKKGKASSDRFNENATPIPDARTSVNTMLILALTSSPIRANSTWKTPLPCSCVSVAPSQQISVRYCSPPPYQ